MPYLYTLTHKGRILAGGNKRADKIRVDRINHDIYVVETVIYYLTKYDIPLKEIESEKELHIKDGFGTYKHQPDFIFHHENQSYAVEVELNLKAKARLEKNIKDNYLKYDYQVWVTNDNKVFNAIQSYLNIYSNIVLVRLEEVEEYVRCRYV